MKKTIKKETVKDAQTLLKTINKRKKLEKLEKELKAKFTAMLTDVNAIQCENVVITKSERSRKNLDKKALSQVVDLSDYETISTYNLLTVVGV